MTILTIQVSDETTSRLTARAGRAGFTSVEQYVQALVIADADEMGGPPSLSFNNPDRLESFLVERASQPNAGEITPDTFRRIRERLDAAIAAGKTS